MSKTALITGITGQDGSYLAEFLLGKGYQVYGMLRRSSTPHHEHIAHISEKVTLLQGDLLDQHSLCRVLDQSWPDEIYNLAAQSHVGTSFEQPHLTAQVTGLGVLRLLEAIRRVGIGFTRFYQASTSELFGNASCAFQDEETPMIPRSPYGCAKLYAHSLVRNYRESYDLFACSGILFNHESPRRSLDFVTRKITDGVARIKAGKADSLELGNLSAMRDWGYAPDYVEAMWLMLQQPVPKDYVIATGEMHSVSEFLVQAAIEADILIGDYTLTKGPTRPADISWLCGNAARARSELGWVPRTSFRELVRLMVQEDVKRHATKTRIKPEDHRV